MKHAGTKIMSLLCLALLFTLLLSAGAYAETISGVSYQYYEDAAAAIAGKPSSGTADCTKVDSSTTAVTWNSGWYVVSEDAAINVPDTRIEVNGEVNLILMDGKTLTANQGIHVGPNATLNIYAQSTGAGAGTLIANGFSGGAGIGGASKEAGGTITIHGGTVTATGGEDYGGAGIGGGMGGAGGTITINGGTVTATSINARYTSCGAGIGSGYQGAGGTITINGGTVNAIGGEYGGAGIGSGKKGANVTVIINDGEVTATGGKYGGAGIGGGDEGAGGDITIKGGTVNATGGQRGGAGIGGGGNEGAGGVITINGGTVNATGGDKGAGIGGGTGGEPGTVNLGNGMLVWAGAGENPQDDNKNIALSFETTHSQQYVYAKISPPIITGADLVLNGSLDLRFYVALPKGFDGSGAYMSFTIPGRNPETGTTGRSVKVNFADANNAADGQKIFPCPVYSIEMAKQVKAEFFYDNGNAKLEKTYSVQDYLNTFTDPAQSAYALAAATKDYGHYMQPYLVELHGFNLDDDYPAMPAATDNIMALTELNAFKRVLNSRDQSVVQALGFYDTFNESTTLTIMIKLREPAAVSATVNNSPWDVTGRSGNVYQVQIPNIAANNLGTPYHVVFSVGDNVICDLDASALSYACAVFETGAPGENEAKALTAFYNYYLAAKDYVPEN